MTLDELTKQMEIIDGELESMQHALVSHDEYEAANYLQTARYHLLQSYQVLKVHTGDIKLSDREAFQIGL